MITTYPAYLQKLDIDSLRQYCPSGETFDSVVLKELMDNALDAAEKEDNTVNITISGNIINIKNAGVMPSQITGNLKRFDYNASEKYKQFAFRRGMIGQGLKLSIAMATVCVNLFTIETGGRRYIITVNDRNSLNPENIFSITVEPKEYENSTAVTFTAENKDDILSLLKKYIILNPHISFIVNIDGEIIRFDRTIAVAKNLKTDISSYNKTDIDKLCDFFDKIDIVNSFDVPAYKRSVILKSNNFGAELRKYAKPVKTGVFGDNALNNRLEQLYGDAAFVIGYKKIETGGGVLELAVADGIDDIISINGSILDEYRLWILDDKDNVKMPIARLMTDIKFKKNIIAIYHSSKPEFTDANKQSLIINSNVKELNKIKGFLKTYCNKKTERDGWHLCDSKDELIDKIIETANEMYKFMDLPITVRQLYYALVSRGYIVNGRYQTLVKLLTELRENERLDWRLFDDKGRAIYCPAVISYDADVKELINNYICNISLPAVDKWHNQPYHLELWYEKDALSNYFRHIADAKGIISYATRGFNSTTMTFETAERLKQYADKKVVILYCGDYDPHGFLIFKSLQNKIKNAGIKRIALSAEQIKKYNLIEMPKLKGDGKIKDEFIAAHGDKAYELDALPPVELIDIITEEIKKYYDETLYDNSKQIENERLFDTIKTLLLNSVQ